MIIYRNGQPIELTQEEMQAAYAEVNHQNEIEFVRDMFLERFGKDANDGTPSFRDTYGFTQEEALDPNSEHYLLERIYQVYQECETDPEIYIGDNNCRAGCLEYAFCEIMEEVQYVDKLISDAKAKASTEDGTIMYYYKLCIIPAYGDDYPVYVKSEKLLLGDEAEDKAKEECYMPNFDDSAFVYSVEAITKEEYDNRLDPDEYCRINYGEDDDYDEDEESFDEDDDEDDDLDCDGECCGCDRACADRIPDLADTSEK